MNWYLKAYENMQMHLAFIDETEPQMIKFTNTNGQQFDEINVENKEQAVNILRKLSFRRCDNDPRFLKLFGLPEEVVLDDWYYDHIGKIYSSKIVEQSQ